MRCHHILDNLRIDVSKFSRMINNSEDCPKYISHDLLTTNTLYLLIKENHAMKMFVTLLVFTAFLTAALTQNAKPPKYQQYYYPTPIYPKWNLKPGTPFKVIPPAYNPSDICFNPNYYGFFGIGDISQTSPIPQPNIYYNLPVGPWPVWCPMNPDCVPPESSKPTISPPESTTTIKPSIKVTRPTMTVEITPPTFNENATTITNKRGDIDFEEPTHGHLDEKSRKMIKHLLKFGSKHKRSNDPSEIVKESQSQLNEQTRNMIKFLMEINKKNKSSNNRPKERSPDEEIVIASATQKSPQA